MRSLLGIRTHNPPRSVWPQTCSINHRTLNHVDYDIDSEGASLLRRARGVSGECAVAAASA